MKLSLIAAASAAILSLSAAAAHADVLYSNPYDPNGHANCSWNTVCGPFSGSPDDFAAQAFTLTSASVLSSATFVEIDDTNEGG